MYWGSSTFLTWSQTGKFDFWHQKIANTAFLCWPKMLKIWIKNTARLQRIQWAAARVVLYQYSRVSPLSSDVLLKQLHWLPIEWRIRFKLATLTFKALHTVRPPYRLWPFAISWIHKVSRSSSIHQLSLPRHNLTFGSRAFRFSAPRVWNSLSVSIRESQSLPTFRCHLKTSYFQSAYPFSCPPCLEYLVCMPWFL